MTRRKASSGPPPLTYWIDRCLGDRVVPEALEAAGLLVKRYADVYPNDPDVPDTVWIPKITSLGWVVLTKDSNITRNLAELAALRRAKARFVCLAAANLRGQEQAECLLKHMRTVEGLLHSRKAPVIIKVTRSKVQWLDGSGWRDSKLKRKKR